MTSDGGEITVRDNEDAQRYEILVGTEVAGYAEYRPLSGARMLPHTQIEERYEGQGLGSRLIRYALDDLRSRGLSAVPTCPFVAAYIREHPKYLDLVPPGQRAALGL